MLRLLSIEFYKLKHNKASKVLTIIYFALLTSIALIAAIKFDFGFIKFHLADQGIFNFPFIWHFNTYVASFFKFFLLIVIVSMISNEYSYKTLKQNLIDGLSKKEFILSKFYMVIIFALISTIFIFTISLILGLLYSDYNELSIIFSDLEYLIAFFIKLIGFFSFGLFMGILVKRSAFAIGGIIVWYFFEKIIWLILLFFNRHMGGMESVDKANEGIRFLPLESMSNLIVEPGSRLNVAKTMANMAGQEITKSHNVQISDIVIVSIWSFIFIYCSYVLLKKRDL
ncbi:MAG: Uncharacterised protein [Flavobacterium sp. SCGC AAA160-P02]|nr:MAG: Uncharacterised protein [Flavobacterium sp. SCGC AAA160-P02]